LFQSDVQFFTISSDIYFIRLTPKPILHTGCDTSCLLVFCT